MPIEPGGRLRARTLRIPELGIEILQFHAHLELAAIIKQQEHSGGASSSRCLAGWLGAIGEGSLLILERKPKLIAAPTWFSWWKLCTFLFSFARRSLTPDDMLDDGL